MTQETPHRPPVRKVALDTIAEYGSIDDDLLVAVTHAETDAAAWTIRATIRRLEKCGTIYNASGDDTSPRWKVTKP
jgi:hypothetical protein